MHQVGGSGQTGPVGGSGEVQGQGVARTQQNTAMQEKISGSKAAKPDTPMMLGKPKDLDTGLMQALALTFTASEMKRGS